MPITGNQPAQLTARAGIGRAGTMRAGAAPGTEQLTSPPPGKIIFQTSGGPSGSVNSTWTTGKQA